MVRINSETSNSKGQIAYSIIKTHVDHKIKTYSQDTQISGCLTAIVTNAWAYFWHTKQHLNSSQQVTFHRVQTPWMDINNFPRHNAVLQIMITKLVSCTDDKILNTPHSQQLMPNFINNNVTDT